MIMEQVSLCGGLYATRTGLHYAHSGKIVRLGDIRMEARCLGHDVYFTDNFRREFMCRVEECDGELRAVTYKVMSGFGFPDDTQVFNSAELKLVQIADIKAEVVLEQKEVSFVYRDMVFLARPEVHHGKRMCVTYLTFDPENYAEID